MKEQSGKNTSFEKICMDLEMHKAITGLFLLYDTSSTNLRHDYD